MTSSLIVTIVSYLLPVVVGYLLHHYGISLPGLPSAVKVPADSTHLSLLQQLLEISKEEAQALLNEAVKQIAVKGLTDPHGVGASVPVPVDAPK